MLKKFLLLSLVFLLDAVAVGQEWQEAPRLSDVQMAFKMELLRNRPASERNSKAMKLMLAMGLEYQARYKEALDSLRTVRFGIEIRDAHIDLLQDQIKELEQRNRNLYGAGIAVLSVVVLLIVCWIWDKRRNRAKSFEQKERTP